MDRPSWRPEDAELALRASDGQQWAFEELVERHGDILHFNACALYAPGEDYEDLLQAARLGLYKAAITFDPSRGVAFRSFAGLAAKAEVITALKSATRHKHAPLNSSARFEAPAGEDGATLAELLPAPSANEPEEQAIAKEELWRVVKLCGTRLSELERTVLARNLRGLPLAQCGAGLGTAARADKTADNALQRIRRKLAA